ncbi:MAG: vancomycin high temperature exclusion protein [Cyclobacteriaceae bacterium]
MACKKRIKLIYTLAGLFLLTLLLVLGTDFYVSRYAAPYCYEEINKLPANQVGLLLGTSKYVIGGKKNLYYQHRINAAVELFESGKISDILVSGDNALMEYNEPVTIQKDLLARGIPKKNIYLDYAGFDTFDSVVRASAIFGQKQLTVISQRFQNERAIYIGRHKGLELIGFSAEAIEGPKSTRVMMREKLARVKALLEVHVLNMQPKFLGDTIRIETSTNPIR